MPDLAERMKEIERTFGLGIGEIAALCGVSSSAVSQWFGRGNRATLKIDNVRAAIELERRTGWNALWIAYGDAPKILARAPDTTQSDPDTVKPVPTIGETIMQMAALLESMDDIGRASIGPLILRVVDNPQLAARLARTADAIAQSQQLPLQNASISNSAGRAQASPVETGLSPLEQPK